MLDISNLVSAEEEIGARLKEAQQARDVAERSLAQVDALREANEALTRTLDLEHVLQALLDSLAHFIPRGRAGVFLLDGRARLVLQTFQGDAVRTAVVLGRGPPERRCAGRPRGRAHDRRPRRWTRR